MKVILVLLSLAPSAVFATPPDVLRSGKFQCSMTIYQRGGRGLKSGWKQKLTDEQKFTLISTEVAECADQLNISAKDGKEIKKVKHRINSALFESAKENSCIAKVIRKKITQQFEGCRNNLIVKTQEFLKSKNITVNDISVEGENNVIYSTHDDITGAEILLKEVPEFQNLITYYTSHPENRRRTKTITIQANTSITLEDLKAKN